MVLVGTDFTGVTFIDWLSGEMWSGALFSRFVAEEYHLSNCRRPASEVTITDRCTGGANLEVLLLALLPL